MSGGLLDQRARGARPQRGKNGAMIGAIGLQGILASINLLKATAGLTFETFVSQRLGSYLGQGAGVGWDNSTIPTEIEKAIRTAEVRLINLPFYSPDFNPIANF